MRGVIFEHSDYAVNDIFLKMQEILWDPAPGIKWLNDIFCHLWSI